MKMTVICEDRTVVVDGDPRVVNKDVFMPEGVWAIRWYGKRGEVEYPIDDEGKKKENEEFFDLSPYQYLVDAHDTAKQRDHDAKTAADEAAAAAKTAREKAAQLRREGA